MKILKISNPTIVILVIAFTGNLFQYLFNAFLAQHLDPKLFGDFSIAKTFLALGATFCVFGTDLSTSRFVKLLDTTGKFKFVRWCLKVLNLSSIMLFLGLIPPAVFLLWAHFYGIHDFNNYHLAIGLVAASPVIAIFIIIINNINARQKPLVAMTLNTVVCYGLLFSCSYLAARFISPVFDNETIISIYIAAFLILSLTAGWYFYSVSKSFNVYKLATDSTPNHPHQDQWNAYSKKSLLLNLFSMLLFMIDLLVIEAIAHDELLVGVFSVCTVITSFFWIITQNYLFDLKTKTSSLLASDEGKQRLQTMYNKAFLSAALLLAIVMTVIVIFHNEILRHFGDQYTHAWPILLLLSINCIICFLFYSPRLFLIYGDQEKFIVWFLYLKLTTLLIICAPLTYYFSITGTAYADIITSLLFGIISYLKYRKVLTIKLFVLF